MDFFPQSGDQLAIAVNTDQILVPSALLSMQHVPPVVGLQFPVSWLLVFWVERFDFVGVFGCDGAAPQFHRGRELGSTRQPLAIQQRPAVDLLGQ